MVEQHNMYSLGMWALQLVRPLQILLRIMSPLLLCRVNCMSIGRSPCKDVTPQILTVVRREISPCVSITNQWREPRVIFLTFVKEPTSDLSRFQDIQAPLLNGRLN